MRLKKLLSENAPNPGIPIVVSGPSGAGKGTVVRALFDRTPGLTLSISMTTRPPRSGEEEGKHYFFRSRDQFMRAAEDGALIEWAEFCGNCYGTPLAPLEKQLAEGRDVILEIDVQGGASVREKLPNGVYVFVLPPSWEALRARLEKRGSEDSESLSKRLEIARAELRHIDEYDYVVVNETVETCAEAMAQILAASHHRREQIEPLLDGSGWTGIFNGDRS